MSAFNDSRPTFMEELDRRTTPQLLEMLNEMHQAGEDVNTLREMGGEAMVRSQYLNKKESVVGLLEHTILAMSGAKFATGKDMRAEVGKVVFMAIYDDDSAMVGYAAVVDGKVSVVHHTVKPGEMWGLIPGILRDLESIAPSGLTAAEIDGLLQAKLRSIEKQ